MSHSQDFKQQNMLAALTTTQRDIGDLENEYVDDLITLPTKLGTQDLWHEYWDELTIPIGSFFDRANLWLISLGFTGGSVQDKWAAYWASFSFTSVEVEESGITLVAQLSEATSSVGATLETGVSVLVNDVTPNIIVSSVLAGDALSITYTLTDTLTGTEDVHLIYDSQVGAITSAVTGALMISANVLADNNAIINLYVNKELAGGAISGDGSPFPPTSHSLNFNQVVTSAPIDIGGGFFNWHSNTLNETGRAYLGYDMFDNNPALPVGIYEFTYDCENTNPATQGQVFTAPLAGPNMTEDYILRNLGAFGTTVRLGATLTVTGPLQSQNPSRVGSGTSSANNRACIIKNPRLTKVGDI